MKGSSQVQQWAAKHKGKQQGVTTNSKMWRRKKREGEQQGKTNNKAQWQAARPNNEQQSRVARHDDIVIRHGSKTQGKVQRQNKDNEAQRKKTLIKI